MLTQDTPVLILAISTRCGSTWVQRAFTSTRKCYVWGEGLELTTQADGVNTAQTTEASYREAMDGPGMVWQANIRPLTVDAVQGMRARCLAEFAVPAAREGYTGWGLKEVRWTPEGVDIFRAAFPKCKIITVIRSFDMCFASSFMARTSYDVADVARFAQTWCEHAESIAYWVNDEKGVRLSCVANYDDDAMEYTSKHLNHLVKEVTGAAPSAAVMKLKLSRTAWEGWQDVKTKSPKQLEAIWPWRDRIWRISRLLWLPIPTL